MEELLIKQLCLDYGCTKDELLDDKNHLYKKTYQKGRRLIPDVIDSPLQMISINNKVLLSLEDSLYEEFSLDYEDIDGPWSMDTKSLLAINGRLEGYGYQLKECHPFFIKTEYSNETPKEWTIRFFEEQDIEQFRDTEGLDEAFAFKKETKDVLGCGAYLGEELIGMAGASSDGEYMWQIGINVMEEYEGLGVATDLVTRLSNEILRRGKLPYYGTSISHITSQKVALNSGFKPGFCELICEKIR